MENVGFVNTSTKDVLIVQESQNLNYGKGMRVMEIQEIIQALEDSKKTLDQLTIQLANASKERNTKELEYNKRIQVEIEKARQEGIQATLIKDVVKSRLAELMFELNMATSKETFLNNRLKDERENSKILITLLSFKKEEMKLI